MLKHRQMKRRVGVLASLSAAVLAGGLLAGSLPAQAATAAPAVVTVAQPPPVNQEDLAVKLRKEFGLRSDLAWIRQVAAAPDSRTDTLGIPLTPGESENIAARSKRLVPIANALESTGAALPGYSGLWIDQAAGGVPHLLVTNPAPAALATLKSLAGANAIVDSVPTSKADLKATEQRVRSYLKQNRAFRDALVGFGIADKNNTVDVRLAQGTDPGVEKDLLALTGTKGVSVTYVADQFKTQSRDRPNTFPLYGGQWTQNCTVGYSNAQIGTGGRLMARPCS